MKIRVHSWLSSFLFLINLWFPFVHLRGPSWQKFVKIRVHSWLSSYLLHLKLWFSFVFLRVPSWLNFLRDPSLPYRLPLSKLYDLCVFARDSFNYANILHLPHLPLAAPAPAPDRRAGILGSRRRFQNRHCLRLRLPRPLPPAFLGQPAPAPAAPAADHRRPIRHTAASAHRRADHCLHPGCV